jgi:hypothetical protein
MKNAYDLGGEAYRDGLTKHSNPYAGDTEGRDLWYEGWEGAYLESKLYGGTMTRQGPPTTPVSGALFWLVALGLGIAFAAWLWGW